MCEVCGCGVVFLCEGVWVCVCARARLAVLMFVDMLLLALWI